MVYSQADLVESPRKSLNLDSRFFFFFFTRFIDNSASFENDSGIVGHRPHESLRLHVFGPWTGVSMHRRLHTSGWGWGTAGIPSRVWYLQDQKQRLSIAKFS